MTIKKAVDKFNLDITINELQLMNSHTFYPDMSYNTLLYLNIISYKKNCTASFIASSMNISKSAVTIKINEMIRQGFVTKTQCKTDKRINYLTVNEAIKTDYDLYDKSLLESVKLIEQSYSQEEISTFCEILNLIGKGYSKVKL